MIPLHHLVLRKLNERPLSGYSLAKEIEHSTGYKPSYGSIYPLLERMAKEGLVSVHEEGRKKIYTITRKGRETDGAFKEQHEKFLQQMISNNRMFCELSGQDPAPMLAIFERLKKGEDPLGSVNQSTMKTHNLMLLMAHDGRIKRHAKEINAIFNDAFAKLKKLK